MVEAHGTVIGFPAPRVEPLRDLPSIVVTVTPSRALRAARQPEPFNSSPASQTVQTLHANEVETETDLDLGLGKLSFVQLRSGKRSKLLVGLFLLSLMLAAGGLGRWLGTKLLPDDELPTTQTPKPLVTSIPVTARVRTPEPEPAPISAPAAALPPARAAQSAAEPRERPLAKSSPKPAQSATEPAKSAKKALPELEAKPGSVFDTPLRPPAE